MRGPELEILNSYKRQSCAWHIIGPPPRGTQDNIIRTTVIMLSSRFVSLPVSCVYLPRVLSTFLHSWELDDLSAFHSSITDTREIAEQTQLAVTKSHRRRDPGDSFIEEQRALIPCRPWQEGHSQELTTAKTRGQQQRPRRDFAADGAQAHPGWHLIHGEWARS